MPSFSFQLWGTHCPWEQSPRAPHAGGLRPRSNCFPQRQGFHCLHTGLVRSRKVKIRTVKKELEGVACLPRTRLGTFSIAQRRKKCLEPLRATRTECFVPKRKSYLESVRWASKALLFGRGGSVPARAPAGHTRLSTAPQWGNNDLLKQKGSGDCPFKLQLKLLLLPCGISERECSFANLRSLCLYTCFPPYFKNHSAVIIKSYCWEKKKAII